MKDNPTIQPTETASSWILRIQSLRAWIRRGWPFAAGTLAALLAIWLYNVYNPPPEPLNSDDVGQIVVEAMASATPPPAYSTLVYQTILPSLVIIQTKQADLLEGRGIGTGVVVNSNGDILTSLHVVDGADEIELFFADGSETTATIIAAEPENDIAVLQSSPPPGLIVPAVLGNPNSMRVGDETFAVGNPLGLAGSMSAGVISGFDRTLPISETGQKLTGLIQFDAAVNPGNSGGPLLNRQGQVVGIVTALVNPAEQNFFSGIGFAVPIDAAVSTAGGPGY